MIQSFVHTRNLYCDISDLKQIFLIGSSPISEVSNQGNEFVLLAGVKMK